MNSSYTVYFKNGRKIIGRGSNLKLIYEKNAAKIYQGDDLVAVYSADSMLGVTMGEPEDEEDVNN